MAEANAPGRCAQQVSAAGIAPPPRPPPPRMELNVEVESQEESQESYMSDVFVQDAAAVAQRVGVGGVDPRTDLPEWKRKAKVRAAGEAAAKRQRGRAMAGLPGQRLSQGMGTPIAPENKGFLLLAKMGYSGQGGLGANAQGRAAPVAVELKQGRGGLGLEALRRQQEVAKTQANQYRVAKRVRDVGQLQDDYQCRMRQKHAERQAIADLPKAQHACEILDRKAGVESSTLWFRERRPVADIDDSTSPHSASAAPESAGSTSEPPSDEDVFALLELTEQLAIVVDYLQKAHFYCFWYGHAQPSHPFPQSRPRYRSDTA